VPDAPGPLTLTLNLESPAGKSTNRYDSSVGPTV
jgi:hypothetical protein